MKNTKLTGNLLLDLHTAFSKLPVNFREIVSEECKYSTPTFYRKMRGIDKPDPSRKGKIIPALSNAEKEAIIKLAEYELKELISWFEKSFTNSKS
jgi:hypothetical protein